MATLGDFGVDVPDETDTDAGDERDGEDPGTGWLSRPNSRCPAITEDGTRCGHPRSRMNDHEPFCGVHGEMDDPLTINAPPNELIRTLGRKAARCRAIQTDGNRCPNACPATDYYCGVHEDWTGESVNREDLDPTELDVDLIHRALRTPAGGDGDGD